MWYCDDEQTMISEQTFGNRIYWNKIIVDVPLGLHGGSCLPSRECGVGFLVQRHLISLSRYLKGGKHAETPRSLSLSLSLSFFMKIILEVSVRLRQNYF